MPERIGEAKWITHTCFPSAGLFGKKGMRNNKKRWRRFKIQLLYPILLKTCLFLSEIMANESWVTSKLFLFLK